MASDKPNDSIDEKTATITDAGPLSRLGATIVQDTVSPDAPATVVVVSNEPPPAPPEMEAEAPHTEIVVLQGCSILKVAGVEYSKGIRTNVSKATALYLKGLGYFHVVEHEMEHLASKLAGKVRIVNRKPEAAKAVPQVGTEHDPNEKSVDI